MKSKIRSISTLIVILLFIVGCTQVAILSLNQVELTKISVQDEKIYLLGEFNSQSYDQVKTAIDSHSGIKTIVLTANPGSLDDETTFKLARYIREKGLNTHLLSRSVIASGAVDLFLSGVNRTIEKGAQLGVHSWSDGSKQAKDFPRNHPDHNFNASYIKDMLGTDEFYWFTIYAAPADSIYWMNDEEIKAYKLTTQAFVSPTNKPTPFGEAFNIAREDILQN